MTMLTFEHQDITEFRAETFRFTAQERRGGSHRSNRKAPESTRMTPKETPPKNTNHEDSAGLTISVLVYGTLTKGLRESRPLLPRRHRHPARHRLGPFLRSRRLSRPRSARGVHPRPRCLRPARRCRHPGPLRRPYARLCPQHPAPRRLGPRPGRTHHLPRSRPKPAAPRLPRRLPARRGQASTGACCSRSKPLAAPSPPGPMSCNRFPVASVASMGAGKCEGWLRTNPPLLPGRFAGAFRGVVPAAFRQCDACQEIEEHHPALRGFLGILFTIPLFLRVVS